VENFGVTASFLCACVFASLGASSAARLNLCSITAVASLNVTAVLEITNHDLPSFAVARFWSTSTSSEVKDSAK